MVIDRGEHEGLPLVVLEHVRGENLHERIERFAPLGVHEVVSYCLQIARALAYAHGHGVVHGNLRPGNVLLTEERDVKLVDFGGGSYVAQLVGDPFAAPELREVDADTPPEPSDDIYALGALAFVALTEQAPRSGLDQTELQLLRPDVSPKLAAAIARSLATDPADRHLSMREMAAELAAISETQGGAAPAAPAVHRDAGQPTQAWTIDDGDEHTDDMTSAIRTEPIDDQRRAERSRRPARDPRTPRTPREHRARILAWSMVLAPLLALVIFGLMIAGERSSDQIKSQGGASGGPTTPVELTGVVSFDPEPGGDGSEHAEETANVFDQDPETTWQTEGYATTDFNAGQKPGVGLVLQLDGEHEVRDLQVATDLPGWIAEVRWAPTPSPSLDGWTVASEPTPMRRTSKIPVDLGGEETGFVLLWITQLAIDTEDTNKARARISEVRVFAGSSSSGS